MWGAASRACLPSDSDRAFDLRARQSLVYELVESTTAIVTPTMMGRVIGDGDTKGMGRVRGDGDTEGMGRVRGNEARERGWGA